MVFFFFKKKFKNLEHKHLSIYLSLTCGAIFSAGPVAMRAASMLSRATPINLQKSYGEHTIKKQFFFQRCTLSLSFSRTLAALLLAFGRQELATLQSTGLHWRSAPFPLLLHIDASEWPTFSALAAAGASSLSGATLLTPLTSKTWTPI